MSGEGDAGRSARDPVGLNRPSTRGIRARGSRPEVTISDKWSWGTRYRSSRPSPSSSPLVATVIAWRAGRRARRAADLVAQLLDPPVLEPVTDAEPTVTAEPRARRTSPVAAAPAAPADDQARPRAGRLLDRPRARRHPRASAEDRVSVPARRRQRVGTDPHPGARPRPSAFVADPGRSQPRPPGHRLGRARQPRVRRGAARLRRRRSSHRSDHPTAADGHPPARRRRAREPRALRARVPGRARPPGRARVSPSASRWASRILRSSSPASPR